MHSGTPVLTFWRARCVRSEGDGAKREGRGDGDDNDDSDDSDDEDDEGGAEDKGLSDTRNLGDRRRTLKNGITLPQRFKMTVLPRMNAQGE
jgi:hypothetical protein